MPTADNPADPHAATMAGRSLQRSREPNDLQGNGHSKIKPWITPGTGKTDHELVCLLANRTIAATLRALARQHQGLARGEDPDCGGRGVLGDGTLELLWCPVVLEE
jgi:hypothetical protein